MTTNTNEQNRLAKSIMYKIISLSYSVYIDEQTTSQFIVNVLQCYKCKQIWDNSISECFYCGIENYHVLKCDKCNELYPITHSLGKCYKCNNPLYKPCINTKCITNNASEISEEIKKKGGVFERKKSGATLKKMRCSHCGCGVSRYNSLRLEIIFDRDLPDINENNTLLLKYNNDEYPNSDDKKFYYAFKAEHGSNTVFGYDTIRRIFTTYLTFTGS